MGELTEQLKKYLHETSKEQLEKDFFEIECLIHDVDPNTSNAHKLLRKVKRRLYWKSLLPTIQLYVDATCAVLLFICAGSCIAGNMLPWAFFNIFWGMWFLCKVINKTKK